MKIALGNDHAATALKNDIAEYLKENGIEYIDCGTDGSASVDYPDYAEKTCLEVLSGSADRGILICGTGVGMSIAANKLPGIRAACCSDTYSVKYTRMHNDANALCFGARVVGTGLARELVHTFITTDYEGGRHALRVAKIAALEGKYLNSKGVENE